MPCLKVLIWLGFVIPVYTKQTEDGGSEQREPSTASAIQQHLKPNEYVEFLPELRTMKIQIALLKYFKLTHTHCTYSVELTKRNEELHIRNGQGIGDSSTGKANVETF